MFTMNNTTNINELAKTLNEDFVYFYEMKDGKEYNLGSRQERQVKAQLEALTQDQLIELRGMITQDKEFVNRYFAEYFENLPEATEVEPSKLSTIFSNAWYYMKKGIYATFSECLKAAWRAYKTVKALKNGIVSFSYRKATGAIRTATGTLNGSLYAFTGKGVRTESKPDAIKYYDTEKDGWRMFRIERLLQVAA